MAQGTDGRDHNPYGFTIWLAGGGVKGGTIHGATDDYGYHAVENKVEIHDLHATMLHLLGIDHKRLTYRFGGRDMRLTDVHGEIVTEHPRLIPREQASNRPARRSHSTTRKCWTCSVQPAQESLLLLGELDLGHVLGVERRDEQEHPFHQPVLTSSARSSIRPRPAGGRPVSPPAS